jgi:DNA-binding transcriptional MerR regulator
MIKIGDFARLSQVSVVTRRYYDEMDLLKPVRVDVFTGYRFYSADQLPLLNRILALKDLGFSLEQIKLMLPCWNGSMPTDIRLLVRTARSTSNMRRVNCLTPQRRSSFLSRRLDRSASCPTGIL